MAPPLGEVKMENYVRVAVQKALESTLMERPKMELELGSRRRIET